MWEWIGEPSNLFAVFLVRVSICLFFNRLVPPKKIYHRTIWGMIAALTISDLYVSVYFFFQCRPLRKLWEPEIPGSCFGDVFKASAIWIYQGVFAGLVRPNGLSLLDQPLK